MLTDSNGEVIHLSSHEVLFSSLKSVSNGSDWLRAFSVSCWLIPLDDQSHPIRINDQWDAPLLPSNLTSCHVQIQKENWWLNSWWKFFLMDHGRAPLIRVPIKPLIYCVLTEANHQHEPVRRADRLHTGKPIRHPLSELLELFHRYLMTTIRISRQQTLIVRISSRRMIYRYSVSAYRLNLIKPFNWTFFLLSWSFSAKESHSKNKSYSWLCFWLLGQFIVCVSDPDRMCFFFWNLYLFCS